MLCVILVAPTLSHLETHAMNRLIATLALITIGSLGLGAGCAPKPVSSQNTGDPLVGRDSVILPEVTPMPTDLVRAGEISVDGAAAFATMTVAELALLQAQTQRQYDSAERVLASGAYLGDPVRVVRIRGDEHPGVLGYDAGADLGTGFETEYLVRFQDGGGDVVFEIVGEPIQPGRRMPSMFRVEFHMQGGVDGNSVVLNLGDEGAALSELGRADLPPFTPDDFAHRIGVRYEPGSITVLHNGEVVLEAVARLGGENATAAILAHPAESVYVLSWTFEPLH